MTDTKPTPTPAATKPAAAADATAKREGFANAAIKDAAQKKAAVPRTRKPAAARKPDAAASLAKLKEGAAENIQAALDKGDPLTLALGNERGPINTIEPVAVALEPNPARRGGKYQLAENAVHNTHPLPRTTQFSHVWLMSGKRPLDASELGAPVGLSPGQQLEFRRGKLTFG